MSMEAFREQVLLAAHHQGGIRLKPCLVVDADWFRAIQADCARIISGSASSEVGSREHPTHWTRPYGKAIQFSLFNRSGDTSDTTSDHSHSTEGKAFAFPALTSLHRLFHAFEPRVLNFRLNGLRTGSGLSPHEETIEHGDEVRLRFHLPIFTTPRASVLLDERKYRLAAGNIYFFNNGCVHAAQNEAEEPRFHLVWDMFLDEWLWRHVIDAESPSVPDKGFSKITPAAAENLLEHEDHPVDEYVCYRPNDGILRATRQKGEDGLDRWVMTPV
jgi:hypothetical protein